MMDNCLDHKREVAGLDMKQLAGAIADLHYECLPELFLALAEKFGENSTKDMLEGKNLTATKLRALALAQLDSVERSRKLWDTVKKHMEEEEPDVNKLAS